MFYETATNQHKLAHDPFKAIVSPRPIGWISTLSADGISNLAPYSFFNAMGDQPKMVVFGSAGIKDSAKNVAETGEFTCNFVSSNLSKVMNLSSADCPPDISEFEHTGLTEAAGSMVKCPRVSDAYAALECKLLQILNPDDIHGNKSQNHLVIGQVVGIHISEDVISNGRFDVGLAKPVSRLGYFDFSTIDNVFEMKRPKYSK